MATMLVELAQSPTLRGQDDSKSSVNQFHPPFQIQLKGEPLDIALHGGAAPTLFDFDQDGNRDLLVGENFNGSLRIYPNVGTDQEPRFERYQYFQDGQPEGRVPQHAGFAPHIADLDQDGRADILSPAWHGKVFWFQQSSDRIFEAGRPLRNSKEQIIELEWTWGVTTCDWENDGDLDILVGYSAYQPELANVVLLKNTGETADGSPLFENPVGLRAGTAPMRIQTQAPMPAAVDWNGDGLFDLVVRTIEGAVGWFPNVGTSSSPKFKKSHSLILQAQSKGRGGNFSVQDYNLDGKLDLLLGIDGERFDRKLNEQERQAKSEMEQRLAAAMRRWGSAFRLYRQQRTAQSASTEPYSFSAIRNQMLRLRDEISELQLVLSVLQESKQTHSHVWVYLQK